MKFCGLAGVDEERRTRKPFLVLGDDPQNLKKRGRKECSISNKKPKPHYNHCKHEIIFFLKKILLLQLIMIFSLLKSYEAVSLEISFFSFKVLDC